MQFESNKWEPEKISKQNNRQCISYTPFHNSHIMDLNRFFFKYHVNSQPQCFRREKNKVHGVLFWFSRDHKPKLVINHRLQESEREQRREKKQGVCFTAWVNLQGWSVSFRSTEHTLVAIKATGNIFSGWPGALQGASQLQRGPRRCVKRVKFQDVEFGQGREVNCTPPPPLYTPYHQSHSPSSPGLNFNNCIQWGSLNQPCPNDISSSKVVLKSFNDQNIFHPCLTGACLGQVMRKKLFFRHLV